MCSKERMKGFIMGVIITSLLTSVAFAGRVTKQLDANYGVIEKIIIDGIDKTPIEEQDKPFTCNATTYVSLRYIANALGKKIEWDGSTRSIYIGDAIEKPYKEISLYDKPYKDALTEEKISIADKNLVIKIDSNCQKDTNSVTYQLNGKAKKIIGKINPNSKCNGSDEELKVYVYNENDRLIYESNFVKANMQPIDFSVDVENKLSAKIVVECKNTNGSAQLTFEDLKVL
jgi:hypothetical protein